MESNLSLQLSDVAAEVGSYLGYGVVTTSWTGWQTASPYVPDPTLAESQLGQIVRSIRKGERWFYTPDLAPGSPVAHKWSFLSQLRTLTVQAGQTTYLLPEDYGGLDGELTYQPSDGWSPTIKRTGIGQINRMLQELIGVQTKPVRCATFLTPVQGTSGQRWQIVFAPTPDQAYTFSYVQRVLPLGMTNARPWPLGGEQHAETIVAACLAAAEGFYNDEQSTKRAEYTARLLASIASDIQENAPKSLGQNSDRSDEMDRSYGSRYGAWPWGTNEPTYNSTPWSQL